MDHVIDVRNLNKTYADGTQAVRDITFQVGRGEFFGFLGPNGAGKSTTIKILITLLNKTSGEANILGHAIDRDTDQIRRLIGYAAQEVGLDDDLTGRENLLLQGRLFHIPADTLNRRVDELLELMDLARDAGRPTGAYSGGMRKRLDLATGLIHRPQILFLDEPTTGLDPQNRANLWTYLERLNKEEKLTIFLTTHYMEEADRLCDRLAIIDHGQLIAEGSPAELRASLGGDVITLAFKSNGTTVAQQSQQVRDLLGNLAFVRDIVNNDEGVNVVVEDGSAATPQLIRVLDDAGLSVARLSLTSPTLDDVFLKYTGRAIRNEELNTNWRSSNGGPFGARRKRP